MTRLAGRLKTADDVHLTGPQSPSVKAQMILAGEQRTDWIVGCPERMRAHGYTRFEVEEAAEDAWVADNNQVANATLYRLANSRYMGANIPGKLRVFMPYVGGVDRFKRTWTRSPPRPRGFHFSGLDGVADASERRRAAAS